MLETILGVSISKESLISAVNAWFDQSMDGEDSPEYIDEMIVKLELSGSHYNMQTGEWQHINLN